MIDAFLQSALDEVDGILGTVTMTCDGQTFQVVIDDVSKSTQGSEIGLANEFDLIACAQPQHVTNPKSMINRRCTVDGSAYRVSQVRIGTVAIHFILSDATK